MKDRIKKIRKELDLTQQKFADKIGVKQNTVAQYEMGRNIPIDTVISLICREFNVNEQWLRNGTGEMHIQTSTFSLDDFVKSRGATEQELEIVKTYFEIDPKVRRNLVEHFMTHLMPHKDKHPDTPEELESKFPPVEDNKKSAG